ncbi:MULTISPECIES: bifunctional 23S rRNA (guanine(2069)-N(7))-methyltransferase RlmK/23S rRNA (guanine(2445)-N(2))-methyltransferase RlmL [unclassified Methylophaga]|jgi:23S rRNA (guanine2445-N2)-methyltransferase / 23S rRNA (guanine2069-N7)-methyltransferase|uniref:bifunctional 23S rRNA (guanine(2069)-N(7))-methyltransferase RlmK/23S rRNA (guanine(2445)-N(2))-methyltransferase RlmL n=3 Tax=Methylophaga TaxID=40222 RepID=UPI000C898C9A|nr:MULTISPECIES: bifunctional 23S rRNA (guanine(2069)-N(7))-methyltransferase RlmK/23S rRNA (guanine(2445)-N(2))-methyltransferase RlmL [unclassified Methylophaga]MAK65522.1 bifunctional 23S rRNA (guanine(2069)-N(7))-methyltransferase RlmK/23S rRNA (guanine(2445)-N(2))-methyltransferase RlmL [Methylophaga sp.]MAY16246.1 bifunctional 23S rRNA (guanine(2069)-N(7))-methyltransferase RlmK/23S rRNA (guanine(2445)-N(2))-methyltransferase RlmL [Methylophaga sp.]|tara:strand:+ start:14742 stop:16976 length:2235 start_codon:yes stop_codon:yes gene_type:complete
MTKHKFTVTAARGMLPLLEEELKQIGIKQYKTEAGSIRFTGSLKEAYQVCLWSHVAVRVLMPIAHFSAETTEQLYNGIKELAWEQHIDAEDTTLAVDFNSFRSKIHHTQFGAQKVKDAIVDRLRDLFGTRPSVDLHQPDLRVNVYLKHNQAIVSLDLSGESLHKRGYRVSPTNAPIKEHLAAAILLSAEWPKLAREGWALLDPMCGSGTFLIEAALMAADIAPGLQRDYFGFLYWKQHDKTAWQQLKADAERRRLSGLARLPMIMGGDQDKTAVTAAQANIEAAGLSDRIQVIHRDLQNWATVAQTLPEVGLVVSNPPYGQRIGDTDALHELYEALGDLVNQHLPAWRTTIITDNAQLGKLTGLTLFDSKPFDNGPIACEVLSYRAPKPLRRDAKPVQQEMTASPSPWDKTSKTKPKPVVKSSVVEKISPQAEMFANRLKKNVRHLAKWARKNHLDCYRVYDADLPDYAVAIDIYGDYVHVQEYAPPADIDPLKASERLDEVMQIIPVVLGVSNDKVALKLRQKQRGSNQYESQAALRQRFEVRENDLRFWINLTDYLDTGLFLDHRITRQMLAETSRGKAFLNLFAYTGSATVYAAAGGAKSTTTVDMSNTYLGWAKDNMQLNNLVGEQHQFIRADVLAWLNEPATQDLRFDLIFVDPPTFSNSNKMEGVFDIQRDYIDMLHKIAGMLNPGGEIFFSTNRRDFKLDAEALKGLDIKDISKATLPIDFERNSKIHYCWRIQKSA